MSRRSEERVSGLGDQRRRLSRLAAAMTALTLIAVLRVASAQRTFSATHDEPAHIACGYEWLAGTYQLDASHPPLARVLGALPLWLDAQPARPQEGHFIERANELLYRGNAYEKNLARARRGTLLLLVLAVAGVAVWARGTFSFGVAGFAAALFTTLPPILGHAGLVTTDLAAVAALPWSLIALEAFYREPDARRGAFLGLAIAFGVLAKFSFLVYFPLAALIVTAMRWPVRVSTRGIGLASIVALFGIWAGYRFQFEKATSVVGEGAPSFFEVLAPGFGRAADVPLPAVSLPIGVAMLKAHNAQPHASFLLGEGGSHWWYYFPVVLFYKTPTSFMILFAWGVGVIVWRRERAPLAFVLVAFAILGAAMLSTINIGVRHILPLYVPASVVAAVAVTEIWKRAASLFSRAALAGLLVWLFVGVAVEHPDYLAWFNEAAQPEPWHIVQDSNLEWGQDGLRLARVLREMQIERVKLLYATNIRLPEHGVHAEKLPFGPQHGWIVIGEAPLRFFHAPELYGWLESYRPVRRIGKTIRVYYIP